MINQKEIINRKYDEETKETISFEYVLKGLDGPHGETQELRVWFERLNNREYGLDPIKPAYKVFTIINSVVYENVFAMPKSNMGLDMVIATGLTTLRMQILEEIRYKETLTYTMYDVVKDM